MKNKKKYIAFMTAFAMFIILGCIVHVLRTDKFNKEVLILNENSENDSCSFALTPQNGSQISWSRVANIEGNVLDLYACSYEGVFSNYSETRVSDWTLRLDINCDCYLNSAWCGLVEVHQHDGTNEIVQKLDLRKFDKSEVNLKFYEDGDIYLFPLKKGDYLIYYPDEEAKETGFYATDNGPGQAGIGMIFYWPQKESFFAPAYEIEYLMQKKYFEGNDGLVLALAGFLWSMFLVAGLAANYTAEQIRKKLKAEEEKKEIEKNLSEKMLEEMIKVLASSIDAKDEYTHGHSERVAQYALMLAKALNLPSKACKEVFYAGLVHDVGKIAIPEEIINKPGKLTDEEFAVIKSHPVRGEKILSKISFMPYLKEGAKFHHERYDGNGYPDHVKGEDIPFLARIIAVADAYDAMTSHRSYRKTLDQRIVKQEIWKGIGTQFDPLVGKHMIALIDADVEYDMRQKRDEKYEIIDEIGTEEYWLNYDPKSIKSEEKIMSDTSIKYFAEFVLTMDHWCNPVYLMEVNNEEKEVIVTSKTKETAEYVWNAPIAILYTSEDGQPVGKNYTELAVFMGAGYSWKTGPTVFEENKRIRKESFGDWNNWVASNKAGLEYRFRARYEENFVYITVDNDLLTVEGKVELPKDFNQKLYVCCSGELCDIEIN